MGLLFAICFDVRLFSGDLRVLVLESFVLYCEPGMFWPSKLVLMWRKRLSFVWMCCSSLCRTLVLKRLRLVICLAPCPAVFTGDIVFILSVVARVEALRGCLVEVGLLMCCHLLRLV